MGRAIAAVEVIVVAASTLVALASWPSITAPGVLHGVGVVFSPEALVRVPLIYLPPIDVAVSEAMTIAVFAGLIAWTLRYVRHPTRWHSRIDLAATWMTPTKRRNPRRERGRWPPPPGVVVVAIESMVAAATVARIAGDALSGGGHRR